MTRKQKREPTGRAKIHAYVATPAYDGRVLTDYAVSLAESCQLATMLGIKVTCAVMGNGAFIDLARCTFINMFLDSDATHLFFIDADLSWEARAFVALLQADYDVSCGVYPRRQKEPSYPVHWVQAEEGGLVGRQRGLDQGRSRSNRVPVHSPPRHRKDGGKGEADTGPVR